ncbi:hypothetical protein MKX03_032048, partial [Papaver bracteatum]
MKNLKLKEENSVNEAGDSSSLTSKEEEEDVMEMKNLKIQETVQSSKSEEGDHEVSVLDNLKSETHDEAGGSSFVDKGSSKVILRSSDGGSFEVEESIAMLSQKIKHVIEDGVVAGNEIPLTNGISSEILKRVF